MMENNTAKRSIHFTLPNGIVISAEQNSEKGNEMRGNWKGIDIFATYPNGVVDVLCGVDWIDGRGTKAIVFESGSEEPVYTQYYQELDVLTREDFQPVLQEMCTRELASKICSLKDGEVIKFYADKDEKDEHGGFDLYGATRIDSMEASHILFNYFGGSSPYVVDITIAEDEAAVVEEALNSYFECIGITAPVYIHK